MAVPTSQTTKNPENFERRLDHDIRILPKPGYDTSGQDSVLLAFDARTQKPLKDNRFADNLERIFGVRAENRIQVPLTWIDNGRILTPEDPDFFAKAIHMRNGKIPGELGGYFGVRLSGEGMSRATNETAAGIAALISEIYAGDEQLRVLYNYTLEEPAEPIEITGPAYNLADEATSQHPLIGLEEIMGHPVSLRHLEVAPDLARVSFA